MDLATVDKLLTTTRTVRRRLDFDRPVDPAVIRGCLEIAIQAPTGGNSQGWRFLVVTDAARNQIAVEGYDPTYGARPLKRVIQQRLQNPLATEILRGEFVGGSGIQIDYQNGEFTFERCDPEELQTTVKTESVQ